jgi:hypothetical protein
MNTKVQFIRQDEVNDIFSYIDVNNKLQFTRFPRSMQMSVEDVEDFIN